MRLEDELDLEGVMKIFVTPEERNEMRLDKLEEDFKILAAQVSRHISLTTQVADNLNLLADALGVPLKKDEGLKE